MNAIQWTYPPPFNPWRSNIFPYKLSPLRTLYLHNIPIPTKTSMFDGKKSSFWLWVISPRPSWHHSLLSAAGWRKPPDPSLAMWSRPWSAEPLGGSRGANGNVGQRDLGDWRKWEKNMEKNMKKHIFQWRNPGFSGINRTTPSFLLMTSSFSMG